MDIGLKEAEYSGSVVAYISCYTSLNRSSIQPLVCGFGVQLLTFLPRNAENCTFANEAAKGSNNVGDQSEEGGGGSHTLLSRQHSW